MNGISTTTDLPGAARVNPIWSTMTALLARLRRPAQPRRTMNG